MINSQFGHAEFVLLHIYEIFNSWQENRINEGITKYNMNIISTIWELFTTNTQYGSFKYFF